MLILLFVLLLQESRAQSIDSIYFNLYTDSLKKGTFNYINVEGKFSDGRYLPLTADEVILSSNYGTFDRNSLYIDSNFQEKMVRVKATVKKNPKVSKEMIIYIKQVIVEERLKTMEEVLGNPSRNSKQKKKKA